MSHHHRGRRTTVPPPAPVPFAPPVTDPARPEWVQRADAEFGIRLLEWQQELGLTCAELLSLVLRCAVHQLAALIRSERAGVGLGGPADVDPKPEK